MRQLRLKRMNDYPTLCGGHTPNLRTTATRRGTIIRKQSGQARPMSLKGRRTMTDNKVTELKPEQKAAVIPIGRTVERHPDPTVTPEKEAKYIEPQIHLLRRVLGDVVLDMFPVTFIEAVEAGYKFWQANPSSYLDTEFDSAQERDDTLAIMRAYAEVAGEDGEGYTIATRSHDNPAMLVWRAQTRRKHNRKD